MTLVPVGQLVDGDRARPVGWYHDYEVLAVEPDGRGWTKVMWFVGCDGRLPKPFPPDSHTMFRDHERVELIR